MSTHPTDEDGGAIPGTSGGREPPQQPRPPAQTGPAGARPSSGKPAASQPGGAAPHVAEQAARHRSAAERAAQRRSADAVIAVVWDPRLRRPASFVWRRRRFRVERVVRTWVITSGWWSEETQVSRHYWRLRAEGRLFDLSFDRIAKVWRLERVLN